MNPKHTAWEELEIYRKEFFKNQRKRTYTPDISATTFVGLVIAYLSKIECKYIWANSKLHQAFFNLKHDLMQNQKNYAFLMEELNFMFSANGYFSEDLESSLTELQMSRILAYVNPEFEKIEIQLQPEDASAHVDSYNAKILELEKSRHLNPKSLQNILEELAYKLKKQVETTSN